MYCLSGEGAPRVVFTTPTLAHYRVKFHERVRELLASRGVEYRVVYGPPSVDGEEKGDCTDISWGTKVPNHYGKGPFRRVLWQPFLREIHAGDLVVLPQENRVLTNYIIQTMRSRWSIRVALWGHGRNFQSAYRDGPMERWKRFWAVQCDWWFTYTDQTAAMIAGYGFPREKITVIQNAVDTSELRSLANSVDQEDITLLRRRWDLDTESVGIYVGSLYREKRIDFLIKAAVTIRECIPNFVLIIIGNGPDRHLVEEAAAQHSWVRYFGRRFGREKVELLKLSRVFLMPGAVGLAVLDCLALGLPMIATDYPLHGPEIAYLHDGENGVIARDWRNFASYAQQVVRCMQDNALHTRMVSSGLESGKRYTIENMAQRFVSGALKALEIDS